MNLAVINNSQIIEIKDSSELFPNTSFPAEGPEQAFLNENSVMEVIYWLPFDPTTFKLLTVTPYIQDGKVYTCRIEPKTQEDLDSDLILLTEAKSFEVRAERNKLLIESDWTQTKDSPDAVDVLWQPYRQLLRDITMQEGFPFNVVFPTPPL